MAFTTKTVTIAAGQSLSAAINLSAYKIMSIITPASIGGATSITFQASATENGTFVDVYDDAGTEVSVTVAASRAIGLDATAAELASLGWVKFRTGTTASPTVQATEISLTLVLKG